MGARTPTSAVVPAGKRARRGRRRVRACTQPAPPPTRRPPATPQQRRPAAPCAPRFPRKEFGYVLQTLAHPAGWPTHSTHNWTRTGGALAHAAPRARPPALRPTLRPRPPPSVNHPLRRSRTGNALASAAAHLDAGGCASRCGLRGVLPSSAARRAGACGRGTRPAARRAPRPLATDPVGGAQPLPLPPGAPRTRAFIFGTQTAEWRPHSWKS